MPSDCSAGRRRGPLAVVEHRDRCRLEGEPDTLLLGVVRLDVVGRHLGAGAPVDDGDVLSGAETSCGPGRVHRDVAATDDDDASIREVDALAELHGAQEGDAAEDAVELSPGTPIRVDSGVPVATRTAS